MCDVQLLTLPYILNKHDRKLDLPCFDILILHVALEKKNYIDETNKISFRFFIE